MGELLLYLEKHAGVVVIVLLAVIALEALLQLLKKSAVHKKEIGRTQGITQGFEDVIFRNTQDVVVLVRRSDKRVVFASENAQNLFGISAQDIKDDFAVLEKITTRANVRKFRKQINGWHLKQPVSLEMEYQKYGTENIGRWASVNVIRTEDGEYYLCTFNDITKEYEKRQEMEAEIQKVYQIDASKTTFLSQMSHEIRTPMNGMLGMISLAKMNMENRTEAEDYLGKAEGLSKFLLSIINDILDMSRIESGKVELAYERVDLFAMAEKLKNMFQVTVEDKGVKFVLEMSDFTVRYVMGDELRISQILTNFLSNASKFTPAGGQITLTFRQMHIVGDKVNVLMRVRDTGKGMSPEFMSRIFNPFEQESATTAKNYGGSGLGMAISDNLVKLMGGQITVDSELGKGSDFTVFLELPIAEGDQTLPGEGGIAKEELDEMDTFSIEGFRILMAEDNKINAIIATKLLNSQGATVENAVNGKEAVEMFDAQEPGYYQIILMDIQMPEMNGWEATQAIRALERTDAKTIPILALSADAFVEDKRKSVAMGMNGHVSKPIDFKELKETIKNVMQ